MGLLMAILVAGAAGSSGGGSGGGPFHRPYARPDIDLIYNLLFCDDPHLFQTGGGPKPVGSLATVLSKGATAEELERIAGSGAEESRVRVLAYNRLRADGKPVPKRQLLGVVVEVPMPEGLDVLAAFGDGTMRYINHTGKLAVVETATKEMTAKGKQLLKAAEAAVGRIGPWDKPRLPPPRSGNVRLTFLVSDGLYFGEGPQNAIARDQIGGPVLGAAGELLSAIVSASTKK